MFFFAFVNNDQKHTWSITFFLQVLYLNYQVFEFPAWTITNYYQNTHQLVFDGAQNLKLGILQALTLIIKFDAKNNFQIILKFKILNKKFDKRKVIILNCFAFD